MTQEIKYYCDECGIEVKQNNSASVIVLVMRGIHHSPSCFQPDDWNKNHYGSKVAYSKLLCPDCLGSNCKEDYRNSILFSKKDWWERLLVRLKFMKAKLPEPEAGDLICTAKDSSDET